ncbi:AMP-binding protein [Streptomyces sp. NPDC046805]|uniref:phenylacetate--CoA ligase family protein n=1 Tax=Streptomyces sp. NPDC046805 TaxID=3155134 RepID=UPI0033D37FCD
MHESPSAPHASFFAPPDERRRIPVDDFHAEYPALSYDPDNERETRSHTSYVRRCLDDFVRSTEGHPVRSFTWGPEHRTQVSRHPVYQGAPYAAEAFGSLPTLSRSVLRTTAEPFDYTAAESTLAYGDQTSGTSGAPLTVVYSPPYMAQYQSLNIIKVAVRARIRGLGDRPVFSVTLTDNPSLGAGLFFTDPLDLVGLQLIWHVDTGDPESLARMTAMLELLNPEAVSSKPNLFTVLLDHWAREGRPAPCAPRFGVSGGAMLTDTLRKRFQEYFGAQVISSYGISEAGYLGSECDHGTIHLDESLHERFEVVPQAGREGSESGSENGTEAGELAVTSLSNRCMPLVRYRVGDMVRMSRNTCGCGAPGPVLDELRGRTTIVFRLGDGQKLSPTRYMDLFQKNPGLLEYQLTQREPRSFLVRVQSRAGLTPAERAALGAKVRDDIAAGMPVPVEVAWEECVFEQEGAKFARFRSEVTS